MKIREMMMNKTAEEAKAMVTANGFEVTYSEDGMFEYSNGSHIFEVDYDDEGVYSCEVVCTVGGDFDEA